MITHPRRSTFLLALVATLAVANFTGIRAAEACGGCFIPPTDTQSAVTDHRMAMMVSPTESVLWDQFRYAGRAEDFAWVLPVFGDVRVELASGEFFDRLDATTAVQVSAPNLQLNCGTNLAFGASAGAPRSSEDGASGGVTVVRTEVVGPYQTVVLRSGSGMALTEWLRMNGYSLPTSIQPIVNYYTERRMDFLALRLRSGEGVQAMQPVRIRYRAQNMVLPLRMVAAGVGDKVGITLWVFGNGRFEAANFANGVIDPAELAWDWDRNASNYREVFDRTQRSLAGGRSWLTEYSNSVSELGSFYRQGFRPSASGFGRGGIPPMMGTDSRHLDDWNLATNNEDPTTWVTRIRSDLLARFLDADLVLQSAAMNMVRANVFTANNELGTRPPPPCPGGTYGRPDPNRAPIAACSVKNVGQTTSTFAFAALGAVLLLRARRRKQS